MCSYYNELINFKKCDFKVPKKFTSLALHCTTLSNRGKEDAEKWIKSRIEIGASPHLKIRSYNTLSQHCVVLYNFVWLLLRCKAAEILWLH